MNKLVPLTFKFFFSITLFCLINSSHALMGFYPTDEANAKIVLQEKASQIEAKSANLLVWNVYKQGKSGFQREYLKISKNLKPDIELFQEATLVNGRNNLCHEKEDCVFSSAFRKGNKDFGVLTKSHFPIIESHALHSNEVEPLLSTPKTSLLQIIQANDTQIMIINTHGINFVSLYAYEVQLNEIVQMAQAFDGPIIWAGDFNSWNPGRELLLEKALDSLDLNPVSFNNDDMIKRFMGFKLDHVFTRGLKVKTAFAIDSSGSDHNPLFLNVSW